MKQLAIKAENISKQYRLGEVGTGTLSHDLNRFWHKVRGLEDPYLKIGEANDRSSKGGSDYVWSLRDINFEIEKGDAVGIIGRNGAGKSTLLKLLSKVTKPTTGSFKVNGRIASLLEVGTGFNPEMTGRENIYLNGAILGMRRHEITSKMDEIIDFSGVERYIDTPVKRYSSGMYVRLAFAVAAHLESEILIVDEVLAVGDAEFQKKCLGKMGDVSKGEGRTVLFVSHNLGSVSSLCNTGLLLHNGGLVMNAPIEEVLTKYAEMNMSDLKSLEKLRLDGPLHDKIILNKITFNKKNPFSESIHITPQENIELDLHIEARAENPFRILFSLFKDGTRIFTVHDVNDYQYSGGAFLSRFNIPPYLLRPGVFTVAMGAHSSKEEWLWIDNVFDFEIIDVYDEQNERRNFGLINVQKITEAKRII
jgi:lipopolysaccharide transport system ATP-binding protein